MTDALEDFLLGPDGVLPAPTPGRRASLLAAAASVCRFDDLLPRFAAMFDLPPEQADALLRRIDEPGAFPPGPIEGVQQLPFRPGPALRGHLTGIVRVQAGATYPRHSHHGPERSLILQGSCRDGDRELCRGQETARQEGDPHTIVAHAGPPLVVAVRVKGGIAFG